MTHIDLHIHSTASDGTFSPAEIVRAAAKKAGGEPAVIALTDHDTTAGIPEFLKEGEHFKPDVITVPGVEISSDYNGTEVHILGYGIDPANKALTARLKECRESRDGRNAKIIERLQKEGFQIGMEDIQPENPGETIARPHIAKQLMKKKYVSSVQEAFDKYLAEGRSCYVERIMPTAAEAVGLILESGGIPVLAHLMYYKKLSSAQKAGLTAELKEAGLIGIEAYYNTYTPVEEAYVAGLARQYGLILTGGTDFHGQNKPRISLFIGQGRMAVPEDILPEFLAAAGIG